MASIAGAAGSGMRAAFVLALLACGGTVDPDGPSDLRDAFSHGTCRGTGVVLVQVLPARQLRVEYFAGLDASRVAGFTPAAKLYER
jgi:hypothetical protein